MTTILLKEGISKDNIVFKNIKELYYFIIESQEFTEMGFLDEDKLTNKQKQLLEKSKKSNNRINISSKLEMF